MKRSRGDMRGHEGDHVTRECLVREGRKDNNSKVHYKLKLYVKIFSNKAYLDFLGTMERFVQPLSL